MTLFHYPKGQHKRQLSPPQYKRYGTYKRWLQAEFRRACVYCRQPDNAPNLNFGADHYRPKGLPAFAHLVAEYPNLFYCCGNCNSRKNRYWPLDETKGPYIPNPCDHDMAKHLRHEAGEVAAKSPDGQWAIDLLQLNHPELVEHRKSTAQLLIWLERTAAEWRVTLADTAKAVRDGRMSQAEGGLTEAEIRVEMTDLQAQIERLNGHQPTVLMLRSGLTF